MTNQNAAQVATYTVRYFVRKYNNNPFLSDVTVPLNRFAEIPRILSIKRAVKIADIEIHSVVRSDKAQA